MNLLYLARLDSIEDKRILSSKLRTNKKFLVDSTRIQSFIQNVFVNLPLHNACEHCAQNFPKSENSTNTYFFGSHAPLKRLLLFNFEIPGKFSSYNIMYINIFSNFLFLFSSQVAAQPDN